MMEHTDWTNILQDERFKFDESKLDISFIRGLAAGMSEDMVAKIDKAFSKAMESTEAKQRVIQIIETVLQVVVTGAKTFNDLRPYLGL